MEYVFDILPAEILNALVYATQSLNFTYDRMSYKSNEFQRFMKIRDGVIIEQACERVLSTECGISLISNPFKTDYRSTDYSELIIISASGRMLKCDVKGFRIFKEYKGQTRTPEMLFDKGFALIPIDQFRKESKAIYVFPFLIANDSSTDYYYHTKIVPFEKSIDPNLVSVPSYKKSIDIGVSLVSGDNKLVNKIFDLQTPLDIELRDIQIKTVDCLFGFCPEVNKFHIYLRDKMGKTFFADKTLWKTGDYWLCDVSFVIAGWATSDDVRSWQRIESGSSIFPYFKTRNNNYGCEIKHLRKLSDLETHLNLESRHNNKRSLKS